MKRKNIDFVGIYRKSRSDYIHQSYVITVTDKVYETVFDESLWLPMVRLRDYDPPRQRINNG